MTTATPPEPPAQHPDELAFLAAIQAAPGDDTPRLVYADWLDEHDRHARADEIRAEYSPDLGGRTHASHRWQRLARTLLQGHVPAAWKPLVVDGPASPQWDHNRLDDGTVATWTRRAGWASDTRPVLCYLRHGFVEGVALPERFFSTHIHAILAAQPVRHIGLCNKRPLLLDVPTRPFAWVRNDPDRRPVAWALSPVLFALMAGPDDKLMHHGGLRKDCLTYASRADAYTALEIALTKFIAIEPSKARA